MEGGGVDRGTGSLYRVPAYATWAVVLDAFCMAFHDLCGSRHVQIWFQARSGTVVAALGITSH